ncbi:hypothetical protein E2C01_073136 [Portunus trituberculatus]|uniref:Uncharacterized protein n=1 Tax=Portunus trituberculatus TaxID=210409 RepID=A0A5B7I8M9_PORTR|nr:hypothetical protein [Portunus trituberculatus]
MLLETIVPAPPPTKSFHEISTAITRATEMTEQGQAYLRPEGNTYVDPELTTLFPSLPFPSLPFPSLSFLVVPHKSTGRQK